MSTKIRAVLATVTLVALLALPFQAFGAKGTGLAATATTLTPLVGTGQLLAYQVGLQNTGKSAITQFRFDGSITGGATLHGASTSPCSASDGGTGVTCELGNLASGAAVELVLVFAAPATPASASLSGAFRGDAKNGTPGAKQDTWPILDQVVSVLQSTADFFGTFQLETAAQSYIIGSGQVTNVNVPAQARAYGVSVGHSNAAIVCGATTITGFGETVELNVANGQTPVTVTITFASQPGLTPQMVKVVHQSGSLCHQPPPDCGANPGDCYDAYWTGSGPNRRVEVTIQAPHNGSFKGFL